MNNINLIIDFKSNGSKYILITKDDKKTTLKEVISKNYNLDSLQLDNTSRTDLIITIKSKLSFREVVNHKIFFTSYKELSTKDLLLYVYNNFNFNIFPSGVKIK